jgi:nitronate monooxygenase
MNTLNLPQIIQGGMGIAVSDWKLAKAVAKTGQLGVVSGTAIENVMIRRLQNGDYQTLKALLNFPIKTMAETIISKYYIAEGKKASSPYRLAPLASIPLKKELTELIITANFCEVYLAKQAGGQVGINYLEKISMPLLPSLYGAMLAGVDAVLMGAGIPIAIPRILDQLSKGEKCRLSIPVNGASKDQEFFQEFDPRDFAWIPSIKRPAFLAIISSEIVAKTLIKRASSSIEGFIIESHHAGGHNAPPRKVKGQAIEAFSDKDSVDLERFKKLDYPYWLAGSFAKKNGLNEALELGAYGIQVGSAFAYCEESGIEASIRTQVIEENAKNHLDIYTDFKASPTGYPFKIIKQTWKEVEKVKPVERRRVCDLGYLREARLNDKGSIEYRCPAECTKNYLAKGGDIEETEGRQCLCNSLLATVGLGQVRKDFTEPPLLTAGEDFSFLTKLTKYKASYTASDIIDMLIN